MDLIVEMRWGSHLFGTATASSDRDLRGVYLPDAAAILLQRVVPAIGSGRAEGAPAMPGTDDRQTFSLQRYFELLAAGQTIALEMLFAPEAAFTVAPAPLWHEIRAAAPRLVSRRAAMFVRYCRQQAHKFGAKGARLAAARQMASLLAAEADARGPAARLGELASALELFAGAHVGFVDIELPGARMVRHLDLCGRKLPFTGSIRSAANVAARLVDEYGARAGAAEHGVDWKAMSHAVRVGREALELFATGRIVFPLACAPHLRQIRAGELPAEEVAAEIEGLVAEVEAAAERSSLPAGPDVALMDAIVLAAHRARVTA